MPTPATKIRFEPSPNATPGVRTTGQQTSVFEDLYHRVLQMAWWRFFAYTAAAWLGVNVIFAAFYAVDPGCVSGANPGMEDAFYFSVQTFATIGYGAMAPATRFGHAVVTLEALVGTLAIALVTGATFARFARPTARVLFAAKIVVQLRDGAPHLVFRLANWRGNMVVEGQLRVLILLLHHTAEGDAIRVPVDIRSCAAGRRSSRSRGWSSTASTRRAPSGAAPSGSRRSARRGPRSS